MKYSHVGVYMYMPVYWPAWRLETENWLISKDLYPSSQGLPPYYYINQYY